MITNYKIDQPFTSNLSVENNYAWSKERKIPVALENMQPAERRSQKSQLKENRTVATLLKANLFRAGQTLFWFPSKKAVFHYSG